MTKDTYDYLLFEWFIFMAPQDNIGYMAPIQEKGCRVYTSYRQK